MAHFDKLTSRAVLLVADDVDTDQIIPARFLKVIDKKGLGAALFSDWRYDEDGNPKPDFVLNRPEAKGAEILVAGRNFGCGSSREHAPWALAGFGFRAVIARSFADIFRNNALKNGVLPVAVDETMHAAIVDASARDPKVQLTIDLAARRVSLPGGPSATFEVDAFAQKCLLEGLDELAYLMSKEDAIRAHEARR
jgi:3-isopropylmalate/(R)-2-methylmalate dehydratase small subunit